MPLSPELDPHFDEAARLNNLDPTLLRALALGESGGNPNARSPAGALGLMQFMPDTAKSLGVDPADPVQAIYGAAKHLNDRLTFHEGQKEQNPNIVPVDEALKDYFAGAGGDNRGPQTAGYPGYIASRYQQIAGGGQPAPPLSPIDALAQAKVATILPPGQVASNFRAPGTTPDTLDAAPQGVAALAALSGQGTAPTPQTIPGGGVKQIPGYPTITKQSDLDYIRTTPLAGSAQQVAQVGSSGEELLKAFNEVFPTGGKGAVSAAGPPAPAPVSNVVSPNNITAPDIRWAQQQSQAYAILGKPVPEYIKTMSEMEPGMPLSPQYQQQAEMAKKLGGNLQTVVPGQNGPEIANLPGAVPSAAAAAGAIEAAKAAGAGEGGFPSKISAAAAEAAIKAGFDLKAAIDPKTGLPGYISATGKFLTVDAGGPAAVASNPYLPEQTKQREAADTAAETARHQRLLADEFVDNYKNINKPGYGAAGMQNFRKMMQQAAQMTGIEVPESLAKTTSSTEAANFISQQLVATAAHEMSPRLAAQLVQQINAVKLSPTITPEGVDKVHKIIYGTTQEALDRQKFIRDYYNGNVELKPGEAGSGDAARMRSDAPTEFGLRHPTTAYSLIASSPFPASETAKAVEILRKNPTASAAFDARFGAGASAKVLGQ